MQRTLLTLPGPDCLGLCRVNTEAPTNYKKPCFQPKQAVSQAHFAWALFGDLHYTACPVSCLESGHCTDASHVLHAVSVLMVTLVTSPQRGPGSIGQGWICGH